MSVKTSTVRCPIHGSIHLTQKEIEIIDSPFFQRLRYISQLGFASFVFPGAVHSRFSHSIGTVELAGKVFNQLMEASGDLLLAHYDQEKIDYARKILRLSALLHDVGHPPFSHAGEAILPQREELEFQNIFEKKSKGKAMHEDFSHAIIHRLYEVDGLLSQEEAQDIISVLSMKKKPSSRLCSKENKPLIYPLLCQLINGEIDVDRMDYLLRDAYYAGVPYGKFDYERLTGSFSCYYERDLNHFLLAIDREALPTYENFLLARIHMFYQIYFHKSLGAYSYYLQKVFDEKEIPIRFDGTLENYLETSEAALMEAFRKAKDKKWSKKLHFRIPAKNLIRVVDGDQKRLDLLHKVKRLLEKEGIETYVSYSSNQFSTQIKNRPVDHRTIMVLDEEFGVKKTESLADASALLGDAEKLIEITQLYIDREDYQKAIDLIQARLPELNG